MPFSSYDDMVSEITSGKFQDFNFQKVTGTMHGAGIWHSLWRVNNTPSAGADPATTPGTAYSNTAGSINFAAQATDTKHIITLGAVATTNCTLMLYDRLVGVSGISVASTGNKTINSTALGRYTGASALDVQCWLEVTTATTTTAAVVNLNSYTNDAGTSGRSGANFTFPAAATVLNSFLGPLPLASGDLGVRSVEVGLNVATAASAGVVNVVLIKPLLYLPLIANQWNERDAVLQITAMPRLFDGASLAMAVLASGTATTTVWGNLRVAWG